MKVINEAKQKLENVSHRPIPLHLLSKLIKSDIFSKNIRIIPPPLFPVLCNCLEPVCIYSVRLLFGANILCVP